MKSSKIFRIREQVMKNLWKKLKALRKKGFYIKGVADGHYTTYRVHYPDGRWCCDYIVEV